MNLNEPPIDEFELICNSLEKYKLSYSSSNNIYCYDRTPFSIFKQNDVIYFAYVRWILSETIKSSIIQHNYELKYYEPCPFKFYKKRPINVYQLDEIFSEIKKFTQKESEYLGILWNESCEQYDYYNYSLYLIKKKGMLFYQVIDKIFMFDNELNEFCYELEDWNSISAKMDKILDDL